MKRTSLPSRTSYLSRRQPPAPGGRIRRKARSAGDFARIYGSKKRLAWINARPCVVKGCKVWRHNGCENVHVATGGMGRKADFTAIVPACSSHHFELHTIGIQTFEARYRVNLAAFADATNRAWLASLRPGCQP